MTEHVYEVHFDCHHEHCPICEGGLANCTVCHGAECALTTECPGKPMTDDQMTLVCARRLDYVNGAWLILCPVIEATHPERLATLGDLSKVEARVLAHYGLTLDQVRGTLRSMSEKSDVQRRAAKALGFPEKYAHRPKQ